MKYYLYLLPFLLIFYGACEKSKTSLRSGIIGEAETWFTSNYPQETKMTTINNKKITIDKSPEWERAISKPGANGNTFVIVPLKYNGPMGVGNRGQTNLVIEKKSNGKFTALIAKGIGTKGYLQKTKGKILEDDFTGVSLFYDWEENFEFGYLYREGKATGFISKADDKAANNPIATYVKPFDNNYSFSNASSRNKMPNFYETANNGVPGYDISGNIVSPAALRDEICFTLVTNFYQQVSVGETTFPPQLIRTDYQYVCWNTHYVEEIDWIAPEPGGYVYQDATTQVDLTTQWVWPPNPVDGQVATYTNIYGETVSFTYSAELGGWMAKTMVITKSNLNLTVNITSRPPEFNSGILLAMSGPALAEPTPVGEIVVGATAVVLGVVWLVQMADYLIEETVTQEEIRKNCTQLYYNCYQKYGSTKPCAMCQQYCITQRGEWDELNCPDVQ